MKDRDRERERETINGWEGKERPQSSECESKEESYVQDLCRVNGREREREGEREREREREVLEKGGRVIH